MHQTSQREDVIVLDDHSLKKMSLDNADFHPFEYLVGRRPRSGDGRNNGKAWRVTHHSYPHVGTWNWAFAH